MNRIIRTETFRAAAILVGVLHICFFPCIWGNKNLMASSRDAASIMSWGAFAGPPAAYKFSRTLDSGGGGFITEPSLPLLRYQYFHERVAPLWNPYQGFGCPLAADQQMQPFYPLTLALLPYISPRTYNWFLLLRLFLAGMGTYLYLRFFVSFWPGIAGGITSMLAGFYVLFISMPELSVEILVSISLLAAEYLLRRHAYWPIVTFSFTLLFVFLGGMPESALMLFVLLYAYILFRIAFDRGLRSSWRRAIGRLIAATCGGLALSAFFLLPFWELMQRSSDSHQPHNMGGWITGLVHDSPGLSIFTYFFPLLYGPPFSGVFQGFNVGTRNYYGLLSTFLLLVAAAAVLGKRRGSDGALRAITWFFLSFTVLLVLKRYGFPGINSLGTLPFFELVNFPKYEEAEASICVSILAAIGLERFLRRDVSTRAQAIALSITALLIPVAFLFSRQTIQHELSQLHVRPVFPTMALGVPFILILGMAIALLYSRRGRNRGAAIAIAAMVTAEMSLNFIAPAFYWSNKLPRISHNPYAGAPYVTALKKVSGTDRIFARDGLLFPNWASAFQLYDIRNLDAIYEKKYFPFVRNFFQDQKNLSLQDDLGDRFIGGGPYELTTPLALRLLQLSSVKYIGTLRPFTEQASPFKLIYNAEAKIYRYDDVLPRAAVYRHAGLARTQGEVLKKLADPSLDIFQAVVLDESALSAGQRARIAEINRQPPARVEAASIQSYQSQNVQIETSLDRPGILVLNDTSYPGWTAQIDGQATGWMDANYIFRAVLVPAGKHTVRFRYQPKSFRTGAAISSLALFGLIAGAFVRKKSRA